MSNNQNKTFIALPGGLTCKPVNPFLGYKTIEDETSYKLVERTNPTYAITEVMPEREIFEGVEDWRHKCDGEDEWTSENANAYKNHKSFQDYCDFYSDETVQFQLAIKPIKAKVAVSYEADIKPAFDALVEPLPPVDAVENKETVDDEYYPISCNHKIQNGKYAGWSAYSLQSAFTSSGGEDIIREFNVWVCKRCGEIKISAKQDVGDKIAYINQEFSIYMPDAVAAIVKNCNYMNKQTDGYIPFEQSQSIEWIVVFVLELVAKNGSVYPEKNELMPCYLNDLEKAEILNMKSDIIKEYNNGK